MRRRLGALLFPLVVAFLFFLTYEVGDFVKRGPASLHSLFEFLDSSTNSRRVGIAMCISLLSDFGFG